MFCTVFCTDVVLVTENNLKNLFIFKITLISLLWLPHFPEKKICSENQFKPKIVQISLPISSNQSKIIQRN